MQKSNTKYGNEHEAIAVYNMMMGVQKFCPIYTLCVGNAFGEAALLLSAGSPVSWGESLGAAVAVTCCQRLLNTDKKNCGACRASAQR